jgi:hypothetical protein
MMSAHLARDHHFVMGHSSRNVSMDLMKYFFFLLLLVLPVLTKFSIIHYVNVLGLKHQTGQRLSVALAFCVLDGILMAT